MKKVFVTGGAGYVGTTLVPMLLEKGYEVTVMDSLLFNNGDKMIPFLRHKRFKFVKGDVRNVELVKKLVKNKDIVISSEIRYTPTKDVSSLKFVSGSVKSSI